MITCDQCGRFVELVCLASALVCPVDMLVCRTDAGQSQLIGRREPNIKVREREYVIARLLLE